MTSQNKRAILVVAMVAAALITTKLHSHFLLTRPMDEMGKAIETEAIIPEEKQENVTIVSTNTGYQWKDRDIKLETPYGNFILSIPKEAKNIVSIAEAVSFDWFGTDVLVTATDRPVESDTGYWEYASDSEYNMLLALEDNFSVIVAIDKKDENHPIPKRVHEICYHIHRFNGTSNITVDGQSVIYADNHQMYVFPQQVSIVDEFGEVINCWSPENQL